MTSDERRRVASQQLNFRVTTEEKKRLGRLRERSGSHTLSETLRKAFAVYELVLRLQIDGGKIVLEEKNGTQRELLIP